MSIIDGIRRLTGRGPTTDNQGEAEDPSHVCQSCGKEYFTRPDVEIDTCRECGGIRVEAV